MNKLLDQKVFYGLLAVIFGITGNGIAQESSVTLAGPPGDCSGGARCPDQHASISMMGAPPLGPPQVGVVTTGGMAFGLQENAEVVKNQPYQAQALTEIKQSLADGSHISQTTTATVARDSDGRTVRIQKLSTVGPWRSSSDSSQGSSPTLTTIFDPVAQTHTDYTSDTSVAHVMSMPALPRGAMKDAAGGIAVFGGGPATGGAGPMTFAIQGHSDSPQATGNPSSKAEPLGIKTIGGISATGTKTTDTIPAGVIGNDKDIVITRETWYSPDLKLVLQSTQIDPRFGETTYSLTNFQRNEPDPTLFQVPAGYKIDKVPVMVQTH
jgi:hypothetical protein